MVSVTRDDCWIPIDEKPRTKRVLGSCFVPSVGSSSGTSGSYVRP